jgi:hypothetical protein
MAKKFAISKKDQAKREKKAVKVLMKEEKKNMPVIKAMTDQDSPHRTPETFPRFRKAAKKDIATISNKSPEYRRNKKLGEAHADRVIRQKMNLDESISILKHQKGIEDYRSKFKKEMERQKRKR